MTDKFKYKTVFDPFRMCSSSYLFHSNFARTAGGDFCAGAMTNHRSWATFSEHFGIFRVHFFLIRADPMQFMQPMHRTRALLAAAACALSLLAAPATAQSMAGNYSVTGKDFDGQSYTGSLRIVEAGPVLRLTYSDGKTQRGMGIQRGNQLFASWGPSSKCTVSALEIQANGNMSGPWGDLNNNSLGTERMTKQAGAPDRVDGTYESVGKNPEGESYDGVATITANGQTFRVVYKDDNDTLNGVGIRQGNALAVSYGGARCGVSIYSLAADGSLSGPYGEFGDGRLGLETLQKR